MRAGFYEWDITPPLGGFLWGHYARVFAQDVYDRIYAKALVVEDGGEVAAIVEVDTCSLPADMYDFVTRRVYEYTGIAPERVCLSCNHTHAGASLAGSPDLRVPTDEAYASVAYRQCADAVIMAYRNMTEVDVKLGIEAVENISFCRNYELNDGTLITHGRGNPNAKRLLDEVDPDLTVVMFEKEGKPIGALINYSAHQCSMDDLYKNAPGYSGDYSSILSDRLKQQYGPEFVSLFALGAAGNVNFANPDASVPYVPEGLNMRTYQYVGNVLADAALNMDKKETLGAGVKVARKILEIPRREAGKYDMELAAQQLFGNKPTRVQNLLHYISSNTEKSTKLAVQVITIGSLAIYCMPGELYSAFGRRIKAESPFQHNIVVENCNYYTGYIPNADCFGENSKIYETSLCYHSNLIPEAGDLLTDAILELAKTM